MSPCRALLNSIPAGAHCCLGCRLTVLVTTKAALDEKHCWHVLARRAHGTRAGELRRTTGTCTSLREDGREHPCFPTRFFTFTAQLFGKYNGRAIGPHALRTNPAGQLSKCTPLHTAYKALMLARREAQATDLCSQTWCVSETPVPTAQSETRYHSYGSTHYLSLSRPSPVLALLLLSAPA